jgi:hypothetical protein
MNWKSVIKVVSCLTGLFLLGSVCGFAMSGRVAAARGSVPVGGGSKWVERWLDRRMAEDFAVIQATPEQQQQLRPAYEHLRADFSAIRQEAAQKVAEAIKRHRQEMWAQLTPEQREVFRQTYQERRLRFWESRRETLPP